LPCLSEEPLLLNKTAGCTGSAESDAHVEQRVNDFDVILVSECTEFPASDFLQLGAYLPPVLDPSSSLIRVGIRHDEAPSAL
jgi:hypothetical protein